MHQLLELLTHYFLGDTLLIGSYNASTSVNDNYFQITSNAVQLANDFNINCHAGHGLNFENVSLISSISNIKELNIGHFLISDAIFNGLENSIIKMKKIIKESTI